MKKIKTYEGFTDDLKSVGQKVSGSISDLKTKHQLSQGLEQQLLHRIKDEFGVELKNYEVDVEGDEIRFNDIDSEDSLTFYIYSIEDDRFEVLSQ